MKKYAFSLLLLVAFAAAITLSAPVMAGGQCCPKGAQAVCVPCPDNAKATATGVNATAVKATTTAANATAVKATAVKSNAAACNSAAQCSSKVCVPCKPGDTCNGQPCQPCSPEDCIRSCDKSAVHSTTAL